MHADKLKVLHYKSNFLNYSETFIKRLIDCHKEFTAAGMCIEKRSLADGVTVFEKPGRGLLSIVNSLCFHLNWCLPFYTTTIKSYEPQIIHAHFGFDGYRMIKPSRKTGIPLVVSFYGSDVSRLPGEFDWKRRYQKLAEHGHAFIAASDIMKKQLIELGFPQHKIEVIRFGLDLNTFTFNESYSSDQPLMVVGRMVEKKGVEYALNALKILTKQGLDVYGEGELLNDLKKKASQWEIDHLVTFYGKVSIEEVRRQYHRHSILLAPSVTAADGDAEGIPNTILEGMASGIPIITTNHAGIGEAVIHGETGFLVEEQNAQALAEAILWLQNNHKEIHIMRQNAREFVEQNYEIERMVSEVENLYKRVLNKERNH